MTLAHATVDDRTALERGLLATALLCEPPYWEDVRASVRMVPDEAWSCDEHARLARVIKGWKGAKRPEVTDYVAAGVSAVFVGDLLDHGETSDSMAVARQLRKAHGEQQYAEKLEALRQGLAWGTPQRARVHELVESFLDETQREDGLLFDPLTDWPAVARQEIPFAGEFHGAPAIPIGHLSILAAQPGLGKSTFALEIAAAVCWGRPCGGFAPTERGDVLYLSAEDGGNIVAQRIEAATGNMGVAEDDVRQAMVDLRFRLVSEGCAALCEEDRDGIHATAAYHALLDYCQEARPRLVVIDPLAAFFHGDEDSAGEMAAFAQMLIRIARASGGAVLLVHHANKSGSRELDMMSARGSVALVAASRYVASMRPVAESTAKRLGCEDEIKQYVEVAVTKTSYGVAPDGSQFLHRGDCGILEVANLHRQHYLDIAERMAAALHETGAHLTAREIARAAGPRAKEVAEMLGDVGITERRRAVDAGLEFGLLEQRNVKEGQRGGSRYEIFPAVYS